ncbi:MAG: methyltransferase [Bryobacteraceae bacterium]
MATPAVPLPLHLGTDAQFAALRAALATAGYTENAVCERLGFENISQFRLEGESHLKSEPDDVVGLLIWLLMECAPISPAGAAKIPMAELRALKLVTPHPAKPGFSYSTAMLYPARGLYVTSDRIRPMDGAPPNLPEDFVYSGIVVNTSMFLNLVPFGACDAFLDLCCGSGIAALIAARNGARHAWAFDLTARSALCAEFNRRLNGIDNMTAGQGDLYEPGADLTFDRIAVHPPYVPVYRPQFIFDSGGEDGEQVVGRIIQGLPRHLRPGGRFYALTMGTDREQPFEHRLRRWLGQAEAEFDVALVVRRTLTPEEYTTDSLVRKGGKLADIRDWKDLFKRLGVETLVYGFLMIQRRDRVRPVFTVRRQAGPRTTPGDHARLLEWETATVDGGLERMLGARPAAVADTRLHTEHRLVNGEWIPEVYRLEIDHPFSMSLRGQAWTTHLLACADGSRTAVELLEKLKTDGALHPDTPPLEFVRMLAVLVSGGFLEVR